KRGRSEPGPQLREQIDTVAGLLRAAGPFAGQAPFLAGFFHAEARLLAARHLDLRDLVRHERLFEEADGRAGRNLVMARCQPEPGADAGREKNEQQESGLEVHSVIVLGVNRLATLRRSVHALTLLRSVANRCCLISACGGPSRRWFRGRRKRAASRGGSPIPRG